jgi:hypothetical protein
MIEAVRTSETSVYSETTRHYIPEGCTLNICVFVGNTETKKKIHPNLELGISKSRRL